MFGVILCLAGGLKLYRQYDMAPEGIEATVVTIVAAIEVILGAALVLRVWPAAAARAAGALFILLAAVALIGASRHGRDCGCFGDVPVPPWVALVVDLAGALALLWGPLIGDRPRGQSFGFLDGLCLGALFAGMATGSLIYPRFGVTVQNLSVNVIASSDSFKIEKHRFLGRPFFLIPFIRIDADLSKGRWKVVLTRPGCRRCDRKLRSGGCLTEGDERLAIVLLREDKGWTPPEGCSAVVGHLAPDRTWVFEPPMTFHLANGKVADAD